MRHLRRVVPVRAGHGSHAAHVVRPDRRRPARRRPPEQHALVLRELLLLHGALPAGDSHHRRDVLPQAHGDPGGLHRPRRRARLFADLHRLRRAVRAQFRVGPGDALSPHPLPLRKVGIGTLALDMFARDRLALTPKRIKGMDGLHAILEKAKTITHEAEATGGTKLL